VNRPLIHILLGPVLLCVVVAGCAGSYPATRPVCGRCEEPDRFVRLQAAAGAIPDGQARRRSHPFPLASSDWAIVLAGVRVRSWTQPFPLLPSRSADEAAFSDEEIAYLREVLPKAFAVAEPDEVVVFGLSRRQSDDVVEVTTGGWYAEEEQLHLILAYHHHAVSMPAIREFLDRDPLVAATAGTFDLVAGPHQTLVEAPPGLHLLVSPPPAHLAIAYRDLLVAGPAPDKAVQGTPSGTAAPAQPSLEERIQILKRLQQQGLITEEEFRTKKRQLLERF
jgi:hypothetical protein